MRYPIRMPVEIWLGLNLTACACLIWLIARIDARARRESTRADAEAARADAAELQWATWHAKSEEWRGHAQRLARRVVAERRAAGHGVTVCAPEYHAPRGLDDD